MFSFEHESPQRVWVQKVVVYEADEPAPVTHILEKTAFFGLGSVERRPLVPYRECFLLRGQGMSYRSTDVIEAIQTFQDRNDSLSMIVVCAISCPGNTPQVTALRPPSGTFVNSSPYETLSATGKEAQL